MYPPTVVEQYDNHDDHFKTTTTTTRITKEATKQFSGDSTGERVEATNKSRRNHHETIRKSTQRPHDKIRKRPRTARTARPPAHPKLLGSTTNCFS